MRIAGFIGGIIIVLGVIVYGSFAVYEGSWSLAKHNLSHSLQLQQQNENGQASIAANGWSYQTMLGQQIVSGIDSVQHDTTSINQYKAAGDVASAQSELGQREYDATQVCYQAAQINSALPASPNTTWINTNCSGGTLKPSSVYYN